ncbi:MAG: hypothetical protein D6714_09425 [Bacteroidetes bacterium]|nr:MAG: hypothetical protein D6714_09425 [Bacteroidota bacterium]
MGKGGESAIFDKLPARFSRLFAPKDRFFKEKSDKQRYAPAAIISRRKTTRRTHFSQKKIAMNGNLTPSEIDALLHRQYVGRIGIYAKQNVYVVPVIYAFDGAYIYGHTREGLKVQMMRENPNVCFQVDDIQSLLYWESAIVQGTFEELMGTQAREAFAFFSEKIGPVIAAAKPTRPTWLTRLHLEEQSSIRTVIFRIKVLEKSGKFEKSGRLTG